MKLLPALLTALLVCTTSIYGATQTPPDIQLRVFFDDRAQLTELYRLGLDIVWTEPDYVEIITNPEQAEQLAKLGYTAETVHESVSTFLQSRLQQKTMGGYKTLSEISTYMDGIIADHPDIVSTKQSIGTTLEGRDIWTFKISDNPNVDEDETEVLYTAAIHAREVITPEVLFHFVDYLTNNYATDTEVQDLVDNREIWIIPICNPDGYYYNEDYSPEGGGMWRKNRRANGDGSIGVDLNRNFGYNWGLDDIGSSPYPSSEIYRGTGPFSEPATQALSQFETNHEFALSVYFHSYSNVTIYPWAYDRSPSPDHDIFTLLGDSIQARNGYAHGLDQMYNVNGGNYDWEYGEQTDKNKIMAMAIEVGSYTDNFWPPLERVPQLVSENLAPLIYLTRQAGNIYGLRAPATPSAQVPATVDGTEYTVTWSHYDANNPAVGYELVELQHGRLLIDPAESYNGWTHNDFLITSSRAFSLPASFRGGLQNNQTSQLETLYPYTVRPGDLLRFKAYIDLEMYRDFAYVEVYDGGRNFVSLPGNITSDFDPYGTNEGNGITGNYSDWVDAEFDLSAYAGKDILIRFRVQTNFAGLGAGFFIDDISPHLVFESEQIIDSDITDKFYTLLDHPMGVFNYRVRARDAENQWSDFSSFIATNVLGTGTGDIDLDGVNGSIADLTLFELYFDQGLGVFETYPEIQPGQTDFDCDDVALAASDLAELYQILLNAQASCYASSNPAAAPSQKSPQAAATAAGTGVELQSTVFDVGDSVWVDIVLGQSDAPQIGFQYNIRYDGIGLDLTDVSPGAALANWATFETSIVTGGPDSRVTIVASAATDASLLTETDLLPTPLPAILVRLKFNIVDPMQPLDTEIEFVWEDCTDNCLALGHLDNGSLRLDSLAVSATVFDADGIDITGQEVLTGGANPTCLFGMFGPAPTAGVDFRDTRVIYDPSCCVSPVGDANGDGLVEPTIGDVSIIIDALFVSQDHELLGCIAEADANQSGGAAPTFDDLTIGDISFLIDYLFIASDPDPLPACL